MLTLVRSAACAFTLISVWGLPCWGQTSAIRVPRDSAYVLVLDHDFTGPHEVVRVFLQEGQVYRAELSSASISLEIRGVLRNIKPPHVYPFLPSETPSGGTLLEIYPERDAEYEIRSRPVSGSQLPTRLRLYRDVEASSRRQYVRADHAWDTGLELAGGWHSGFIQSGAVPLPGSDPDGGTGVESCFTARGAAASSRVSLCVLGIGYESQHGAPSILWVYSEPRLRLLGGGGAGRSGWELGPLFRLGIGMISASPATPVMIAPGAFIARHLRTSPQTGWSLQASYSRPFYKGFSRPAGVDAATPKGHRFSLGIGWYR